MGAYSKCCAKSQLPVLCASHWARRAPRLTRVVALSPNGSRLFADYDGYGLELENFDKVKFVLQAYYAGESYDALPESSHEPGQGMHHDREFVAALEAVSGFPSQQDYQFAVRDYGQLADERRKVGFAAANLHVPGEVQCRAHEILRHMMFQYPPTAAALRKEYPEAAFYLPSDEHVLRQAAENFDEAFRKLAAVHAADVVGQYAIHSREH